MDRDPAAGILAERRAFADTLAVVGPAAPTLAGTWTAADLAAHVVSLDRLAGVPTFVGRTVVARGIRLNDAAGRFADAGLEPVRRRGFAWALDRLRMPPPRLLRGRRLAPIGLFELFVHHEDVRRASGPWRPRTAPDGLATALPWLLRYHRRVLPPVRLLVRTDGAELTTGTGPTVVLSGAMPEVALWLAGRGQVAEVELQGDAAGVEALRSRPLRI